MAKGNMGMNMGLGVGGDTFVPTDVPQSEAYALIALYNATGGPSWTTNTNWLQSRTVNDWFGITVSGGHVTEISLNNNKLNGSMGTVLTPLGGYLTTLDLSDNPNLTYPYLGLQTALATIDISDCGLGSASVAARLAEVVASGVSAGTLDIGGSNSSPNPAGVTSLLALEDDSWTLTYSTVIMENTGSFYAITANGDATIRSSATDLSGQTAKYIVAYDGTNDKYAFAYGHAADSAEALGSYAVNDNCSADDTASWIKYDCTLIFDTDHYVIAREAASYGIYKEFLALTSGKLYKASASTKLGTAPAVTSAFYYSDAVTTHTIDYTTGAVYETHTAYINSNGLFRFGLFLNGAIAGQTTFVKGISLAEVTALGTDALQLRNAATGSTRNWTSIESGFDPNTISKIEVFNAE